jgi:hypothetical protein
MEEGKENETTIGEGTESIEVQMQIIEPTMVKIKNLLKLKKIFRISLIWWTIQTRMRKEEWNWAWMEAN